MSQWNYRHYSNVPSLERVIELLREQGYGIELWAGWQESGIAKWGADEADLFDEVGRRRLKAALEGMTVSLHTAGARTFGEHKKQIDAAADVGGEVVVLHPGNLCKEGRIELDAALCREAVAYGAERNVVLALENGDLPFLAEAIEQVEGLGICLDVGHVDATPEPMSAYLETLKGRLCHLHLQDVLSPPEQGLPGTGGDHYIPGTGGIPSEDWKLIAQTLRETDFSGIAVFEIRPRNPLQTALLARGFFDTALEDS